MKWILRSKGVVAGAGSAMASSGHMAPLSMAVHDLRGDTADDAASVADPYERVSWPHDATPSVLAGDGSLKLPQVKMATVSPGDGRWLLVASDGFTYVVELATGAIQAKVPSAAEEAVVSPQGTFLATFKTGVFRDKDKEAAAMANVSKDIRLSDPKFAKQLQVKSYAAGGGDAAQQQPMVEHEQGKDNMHIWSMATGECLASFCQRDVRPSCDVSLLTTVPNPLGRRTTGCHRGPATTSTACA